MDTRTMMGSRQLGHGTAGTRRGWYAAVVAGALLCGVAVRVWADNTETFTVTIPSVLTISAPAASISITHDKQDTNQAFAVQQWVASANAVNGATASFQTSQAFTNTANAAFKRDVKLDLAVSASDSGSGWTVSTASDQTDYGAATPDEAATVQASSTAPGDATIDLTVTFLTGDFSTIAQGDYATTVTATITAN